jgi:hypothetical protein
VTTKIDGKWMKNIGNYLKKGEVRDVETSFGSKIHP